MRSREGAASKGIIAELDILPYHEVLALSTAYLHTQTVESALMEKSTISPPPVVPARPLSGLTMIPPRIVSNKPERVKSRSYGAPAATNTTNTRDNTIETTVWARKPEAEVLCGSRVAVCLSGSCANAHKSKNDLHMQVVVSVREQKHLEKRRKPKCFCCCQT